MTRITGGRRVVVLALSAIACGFATGFTALSFLAGSLSPSDGAYGASAWQLLGDPVVLIVFIPITVILSLLGFLASLYLLWRVDLSRAVPLVIVVTVGITAASRGVFSLVSPILGLGAGLLTMQWCRSCSPWVSHEPGRPSVFREGLRDLAGRNERELR